MVHGRIRYDYRLYHGGQLGLYHNIEAIGYISGPYQNCIIAGIRSVTFPYFTDLHIMYVSCPLSQCSDTALVLQDEPQTIAIQSRYRSIYFWPCIQSYSVLQLHWKIIFPFLAKSCAHAHTLPYKVCVWARDFARNGKIIFQRNCNTLYILPH